MSYYRGDYYRGDGGNYYRGDPFLGGLIGAVGGKLIRKATSFITRKVIAPIVKRPVATGVVVAATPPIIRTATQGLPQGPRDAPIEIGPIGIDPGAMLPGGRPGVFRLGKKYRRMNPLNPRALRRALRRAEGFEKFAARTVNALYKQSGGRRIRRFKKCTPKSA